MIPAVILYHTLLSENNGKEDIIKFFLDVIRKVFERFTGHQLTSGG